MAPQKIIKRNFIQPRSQMGHFHHKHVGMTILFMFSERTRNSEEYPLLSCADVESLLVRFLPQRNNTNEEIKVEMEKRHKQRQTVLIAYICISIPLTILIESFFSLHWFIRATGGYPKPGTD